MILNRPSGSIWFGRFLWLALVNGALAVGWTAFILWPWLTPSPLSVLDNGSAGTWLLIGYILFLVVGVLTTGITAIFYFFMEVILKRPYSGLRGVLAYAHFIVTEVGVVGATFLLMYCGYIGGAALLQPYQGGGGLSAYQVSVQILHYYVAPIFALVVIATLGEVLGGVGYALSMKPTWNNYVQVLMYVTMAEDQDEKREVSPK
jgi:hypothetical protein